MDVAPVIFAGRVVDVSTYGYDKYFVFVVERSWKGIFDDVVTVTTPAEGGMCGNDFQLGQHYLVYADNHAMLNTNICLSGCAAEWVKAATEKQALKVFGEGKIHPHVNYIPLKIRRQRALLVLLGLTLLMPVIIQQTRRLRDQRKTV